MVADGIAASSASFAAFAADHTGAFSVATTFQLREHLARVDEVLEPALRCLGLRGRLFVSIPDRERLPEAELEPLDCPPHHLSRWGAPQLRALADHLGMRVVRIDRQPPDYGKVIGRLMAPFDARLGGDPRRRGRRIARAAARRTLVGPRRHALAARTGAYECLSLYGHTMLAEMVRE
jgi:hypothetical protein